MQKGFRSSQADPQEAMRTALDSGVGCRPECPFHTTRGIGLRSGSMLQLHCREVLLKAVGRFDRQLWPMCASHIEY